MAPRINRGWLTVGRDQPEIGNLPMATARTAKTVAARATFFVTLMEITCLRYLRPPLTIVGEGASPGHPATDGGQIRRTAYALERYLSLRVCARMNLSNP